MSQALKQATDPVAADVAMHSRRTRTQTITRAAAFLATALALATQVLPAGAAAPRNAAARVDGAYISANASTARDWPSHGLDYAETRFSRLRQIDAGNVRDLGLVWTYSLESTRGVEATPLVADGVMYVTASWSVVHAVDARTGKRLWTFDPKVDRLAIAAAATWSTVAWRCTRARCSWRPTMAG